MKIIHGPLGIRPAHQGGVVTIGNFDGVHLGHQKIIREVREVAGSMGDAPRIAMTFEPHPMKCLFPERDVRLLTPLDEKVRLLGYHGIDHVLVMPFTREFASTDPETFIREILFERLRARAVVVGHNYSFGRAKRGNTTILRRRGLKYGFKLHVVRSAFHHGEPVSSSRIRSLLNHGKVAEVSHMLCRPYTISGHIKTGAGRGDKVLHTPTANLDTPSELVPKDGVYVVRVGVGRKLLDGVMNIGNNPTFKNAARSYEVHILDYKANLVGQFIHVYFVDRLRDEKVFASPEALRNQIGEDIKKARTCLERNPYTPL